MKHALVMMLILNPLVHHVEVLGPAAELSVACRPSLPLVAVAD